MNIGIDGMTEHSWDWCVWENTSGMELGSLLYKKSSGFALSKNRNILRY